MELKIRVMAEKGSIHPDQEFSTEPYIAHAMVSYNSVNILNNNFLSNIGAIAQQTI